jgi:hypothetical protein
MRQGGHVMSGIKANIGFLRLVVHRPEVIGTLRTRVTDSDAALLL